MSKERKQIVPLIKQMIREAYIGKHFTKELRMYKGKYIETTEFDVRHLVFGRGKEMFLIGEYDHPFGYVSLDYERVLELADNGSAKYSYVRDVEFFYKLEEKEEQQ